MPEFVERPPQPHSLASYSSDLKVLRQFKDISPQTLSFSEALRNQRDFVPQVQGTTKEDAVHRCERFKDKSERCRRAMNIRHFPMLRLMDKPSDANDRPEPVSHPMAAGSPRSPQRVMRALKQCDPSTEVAPRPRRISYPATLAKFSSADDKFARIELKSAFEYAVKEPKIVHGRRKGLKPFVPASPRQARRMVASKYPNVRETWNDDEWLGQANAASAYSPRDRALRGVVFSSPPSPPPPRGAAFAPRTLQGAPSERRPQTTASVGSGTDWHRREKKPPFSPNSPSKAKYNIEPHYFLYSSLRSRSNEREEDDQYLKRRIQVNSQKFNDKLFVHFHGRERARQRRLQRKSHRSRSVDPRTPSQEK